MVKNLPAMQKTQVWSLGWKDPLEKAMATHSSIVAWRIPCIRKGLLTKRVFLLMFDLIKNNLYTFQSCIKSYIPVTNSFVFSFFFFLSFLIRWIIKLLKMGKLKEVAWDNHYSFPFGTFCLCDCARVCVSMLCVLLPSLLILRVSCWKTPWTEEPGRLHSMGSQRVGHDWATSLY